MAIDKSKLIAALTKINTTEGVRATASLLAVLGTGGSGSGNTVLHGSGAPSGGTGSDGDFYIDTSAHSIYGPKSAGAWGSPTSLVGPTGATGATGPAGTGGLIWSKLATVTASDWNAGTAGPVIVLGPLEANSILCDVMIIPSADFNDTGRNTPNNGAQFGWSLDSDDFRLSFVSPSMISAASTGGNLGAASVLRMQGDIIGWSNWPNGSGAAAFPSPGFPSAVNLSPAYINSPPTDFQMLAFGNGDATTGTLDVWILSQVLA